MHFGLRKFEPMKKWWFLCNHCIFS